MREKCVCGFSTVDNISLLNLEGTGMIGVPGIAQRLFGKMIYGLIGLYDLFPLQCRRLDLRCSANRNQFFFIMLFLNDPFFKLSTPKDLHAMPYTLPKY